MGKYIGKRRQHMQRKGTREKTMSVEKKEMQKKEKKTQESSVKVASAEDGRDKRASESIFSAQLALASVCGADCVPLAKQMHPIGVLVNVAL